MTAKTFKKVVTEEESVFQYIDTNSSRAGIDNCNRKMLDKKIAIIGIGVSNVPLLDYLYQLNAYVTVFDKKEISLNSANSIICSRHEVLWEGDISSGEIPLSDNINKFKNLKAYIRFYGNNIKDLNFVNTFAYIKEFNLADNLSDSLKVNFVEMLKKDVTSQDEMDLIRKYTRKISEI